MSNTKNVLAILFLPLTLEDAVSLGLVKKLQPLAVNPPDFHVNQSVQALKKQSQVQG